MARDEQVPTNWLSPVDALRRVQELGEQLASAARSYSQGDRGDEDERPAAAPPPSVGVWAERAAELSTMWVSPMRVMLEEQQELIGTRSRRGPKPRRTSWLSASATSRTAIVKSPTASSRR